MYRQKRGLTRASPKGNFYLRTKAEAEQGIFELGFASTTLVRPSDACRGPGFIALALLLPVRKRDST